MHSWLETSPAFSPGDRKKLVTLITVDVHNRDVLAKMIEGRPRVDEWMGEEGGGGCVCSEKEGRGCGSGWGGVRPWKDDGGLG